MEERKKIYMGVPSFITVETEDGSWIGEKDAQKTEKDDVKVTYETTPETEEIWLTADQTKVKTIKLRWNTPVNKKSRILGGSWERTYGDVDWKGISGSRFMPWYFLAAAGETVTGYGVKVRPSAMCFWQADTRGITLVMDVRCGGMGVTLSGRKLRAAQIVAMQTEGMSTFESAREFCKVMCTDPILPEYPVYGSNNWYYAYGDSSEKEILQDTDYIVALTKGVDNPPYMVIDDCWQEHHRLNEYNGGPWKKGNKKFPDMGALAKKLEEKGVRPGIWVRFLLNEEETIPQEWRLSHNDCLDPSHPDVLSYIQEDVERICNWGYTLIKHDFTTFDIFGRWGVEMNPFPTEDGWHFYDTSKTSAEIVIGLYQAIYEDAADQKLQKYNLTNALKDPEETGEYSSASISLDYYHASADWKNVYDRIDDYYGNTGESVETPTTYGGSAYISFGKDCTHIIQTLIDCGVITDVSDIQFQRPEEKTSQ